MGASLFIAHFQKFWQPSGNGRKAPDKEKANQRAKSLIGLKNSGSSTWARTRDLRINSPALYRLSY